MSQATTWATAVAVPIQSRIGSWAAQSRSGPVTAATPASSAQAWTSQARFTGASRRLARWSVGVPTGKATACSAGMISRPPPAETTAMVLVTRKPRTAIGR